MVEKNRKPAERIVIARTDNITLIGDPLGEKLEFQVALPGVKDIRDLQQHVNRKTVIKKRKRSSESRSSMEAVDFLVDEGLVAGEEIEKLLMRLKTANDLTYFSFILKGSAEGWLTKKVIEKELARLKKDNKPLYTRLDKALKRQSTPSDIYPEYSSPLQTAISWANRYLLDRNREPLGRSLASLNLSDEEWVKKEISSAVSVKLLDADVEALPPLEKDFARARRDCTRTGVCLWNIGEGRQFLTLESLAMIGDILNRKRLQDPGGRRIAGAKKTFVDRLYNITELHKNSDFSFLDVDE
ncbi:MAG: hypothetical protein ABH950_01290, partial [Candidatus Altiarchaeota archaeon]